MQDVATLNVAKILAVADAIEHHTVPNLGFDMDHVYLTESVGFFSAPPHKREEWSCGSVACIAGWTLVLFDNVEDNDSPRFDRAARHLGLEPQMANTLFMPFGWMGGLCYWAKASRSGSPQSCRNR